MIARARTLDLEDTCKVRDIIDPLWALSPSTSLLDRSERKVQTAHARYVIGSYWVVCQPGISSPIFQHLSAGVLKCSERIHLEAKEPDSFSANASVGLYWICFIQKEDSGPFLASLGPKIIVLATKPLQRILGWPNFGFLWCREPEDFAVVDDSPEPAAGGQKIEFGLRNEC